MMEPEAGVVAQGYAQYFTTVCILAVTFGLVLMAHERFERQYAISPVPGRPTE